jgi:hypothetical protein
VAAVMGGATGGVAGRGGARREAEAERAEPRHRRIGGVAAAWRRRRQGRRSTGWEQEGRRCEDWRSIGRMCGCSAVFYRVERYGEVSKLPEEARRVVERLDLQRQPGRLDRHMGRTGIGGDVAEGAAELVYRHKVNSYS